MNSGLRKLLTPSALAGLAACATPTAPAVVALLDGHQPTPGLQLLLADSNGEVAFTGAHAATKKLPNAVVWTSDVQASRTPAGLSLRWNDAWLAMLRLHAEPGLNMAPFMAHGTLEFDLNVGNMSQGGLSVSMTCGKDCSRRVNFVAASRRWAGQGWKHLSVALRCFDRDGADFSAVTRPFVLEGSGAGHVELANVRLLSHGTPNTDCVDYRVQSVTAEPQEEGWSSAWWMPRHHSKLEQIRAAVAAGKPPRLVFIGDSITQGWEDQGAPYWASHFAQHDALELGFGGDRTENVLWRLQNGELDGYRAKLVVLMAGTNNTGSRQEDPATTAAGVQRVIQEIQQRQPEARVLVLALFPRDPQPGMRLRRLNERVNEHLARMADERRVFFEDIAPHLMNADGTLSAELQPDWLHLSAQGYARWARAIEPTVARLLALP